MKVPAFSIDKLISFLTRKRWNFHVTFKYQMKPGQPNSGNVTRSMTFSTDDRRNLGCHRHLKKKLVPDMVKELPKQYRLNGELCIEHITYVGWFKPKPAGKPKTGKIGHKKPWYAL